MRPRARWSAQADGPPSIARPMKWLSSSACLSGLVVASVGQWRTIDTPRGSIMSRMPIASQSTAAFPCAAAGGQRTSLPLKSTSSSVGKKSSLAYTGFTVKVKMGIPSSRISNPFQSSLLLLAMSCTSETSSPNCFWRIFWDHFGNVFGIASVAAKEKPTAAISRITFKFK